MTDTHERATRVLDEAMRLLSQKNATYQDAWKEQGWRGNLARIMSKVTRLRNMLWRSQITLMNGDKEHPRETLLDIINCCVFAILNIDDEREWGHEDPLPTQRGELSLPPLPPHPEQPPAMTGGQHHVVIPEVQQSGTLVQENPFENSQETSRALIDAPPSPQPRAGRRKIKDQG
jgi:hypothetical protein